VLVILLMAVAGGLIDALHIAAVRHRAYRVAADAALQGVREGADYSAYISGGAICLDQGAARSKAEAVVTQGATVWGLEDYAVQVEVLPDAGGGIVRGFPPHPNARQRGGTTWQEDSPAIGVYLEATIATFFLGWFNGNEPVSVHAFAAAEMEP
jgi:hypothetical protein